MKRKQICNVISSSSKTCILQSDPDSSCWLMFQFIIFIVLLLLLLLDFFYGHSQIEDGVCLSSICWLIPKNTNSQHWTRLEARTLELHPGSPMQLTRVQAHGPASTASQGTSEGSCAASGAAVSRTQVRKPVSQGSSLTNCTTASVLTGSHSEDKGYRTMNSLLFFMPYFHWDFRLLYTEQMLFNSCILYTC